MAKKRFTEELKKRRLYFDGGMGTLLQKAGLPSGMSPEEWNLLRPEEVEKVHRAYLAEGVDCLTTNTFGLAMRKDEEIPALASSAVRIARKAADGKDVFLAFDIGPCGRLLEPFGNYPFAEAYRKFSLCAAEAQKLGADLVIVETMNDLLETKAALLAVKENTDLPVIVTCAFDGSGKLITGGDAVTVCSTLEGLGADVIGVNCSLGPESLLPIVRSFAEYSSLPLIAQPNAGPPDYTEGETKYLLTPEQYGAQMVRMAKAGVRILGGCCGTTPEHIRETIRLTKDLPLPVFEKKERTIVSSYTHALVLGEKTLLIGERINPTGKKHIKEALQNRNDEVILSEAVRQAERGVHILDVNAGVPGIDEKETLGRLVLALQSVTDLPLQIDTGDPEALESALQVYAGRPLINSAVCKEESMARVFPLAKKYGGVVICLTLDENGIPPRPEERLAIAERMLSRARDFGLEKKDLVFDPLTMTVSSDPDNAAVTLDSLRLIKQKLSCLTSLGVSNVSFGLPERDRLNSAFFAMALQCGLDLAIMNPFSERMTETYASSAALLGKDRGCENYIASVSAAPAKEKTEDMTSLKDCVRSGLSENAVRMAKEALSKGALPYSLIENEVIPALTEIGDRYEKKTAFLPQLLTAAEAAKSVLSVIAEAMPPRASEGRRVVLATVKGDIHDIGKNIVKVLLESFGFSVEDLGKDVDPDLVARKAVGVPLVGLSALMTTTLPAMGETIRKIRISSPDTKIVVGGAVLCEEYAQALGADFYAEDAMETVRIAQSLMPEKNPV